jgi:structural maintenance of chromosome 2
MRGVEQQQTQRAERAREADIELKRLEGRAQKCLKDEKEADTSLARLLTVHPWMESERQFFGKAHTEYDFEDKDLDALRERHKDMEKKQADMVRWLAGCEATGRG